MTKGKAARTCDYLEHMLQSLQRVERYTAGMDEGAFMGDELVQDAVIRNIEIIGEAANNILRLDPGFAAQHADIPWQLMYTMRNRVTHGYDTLDWKIVWQTIRIDLPGLHQRLRHLHAERCAP